MKKTIVNLKINLPVYLIENDDGNRFAIMSPIKGAHTFEYNKKHGLKYVKLMAELELFINLLKTMERQNQILERM